MHGSRQWQSGVRLAQFTQGQEFPEPPAAQFGVHHIDALPVDTADMQPNALRLLGDDVKLTSVPSKLQGFYRQGDATRV